jgi:hypothetical protein
MRVEYELADAHAVNKHYAKVLALIPPKPDFVIVDKWGEILSERGYPFGTAYISEKDFILYLKSVYPIDAIMAVVLIDMVKVGAKSYTAPKRGQ